MNNVKPITAIDALHNAAEYHKENADRHRERAAKLTHELAEANRFAQIEDESAASMQAAADLLKKASA